MMLGTMLGLALDHAASQTRSFHSGVRITAVRKLAVEDDIPNHRFKEFSGLTRKRRRPDQNSYLNVPVLGRFAKVRRRGLTLRFLPGHHRGAPGPVPRIRA
jgi:hypothetical protein